MSNRPFDMPPTIRSSGLGIASTVIGIVAICCAWIPFCGLAAIPLAIVGLILGIISLILAFQNDRVQKGFPIAGAVVNVVAILIAIMVSAAATKAIGDAVDRAAKAASQPAPGAIVVPVSASDLVGAYGANQVGADAKYKDQWLRVSGTTDANRKDFLDTPLLVIRGNASVTRIHCRFSKADAAELLNLTPGSSVTVRGRCTGKMDAIYLENCHIVP